MDPSPDKVPVREKAGMTTKAGSGGDVEAFLRRTAAQEGAAITRLTRDDLEDRYLRIYEDHLVLKRHAHKQEERMKKMATKLMRLVNDKKKGATGGGSLPPQLKDVEAQEKIAELEEQVQDLERIIGQLQEKNALLKQQIQLPTKKSASTIYDGVTSRIDTGVQPKPSATSLVQQKPSSTSLASEWKSEFDCPVQLRPCPVSYCTRPPHFLLFSFRFTGVPPHIRPGMRASGYGSPSPKPPSSTAHVTAAAANAEMAKMLADAREENRKLQVRCGV